MDTGELLTALEHYIFQLANKQFEINEIPLTARKIIMEAVYSKFQEMVIEQMIMNQITFEDDNPDNKKVTQTEENIKETVDTLKDFYDTGSVPDGGIGNVGSEDNTIQDV